VKFQRGRRNRSFFNSNSPVGKTGCMAKPQKVSLLNLSDAAKTIRKRNLVGELEMRVRQSSLRIVCSWNLLLESFDNQVFGKFTGLPFLMNAGQR
ncbi:MAG: hypothetical protein AAB316_12885, partial [Bacteroidota bacterium]